MPLRFLTAFVFVCLAATASAAREPSPAPPVDPSVVREILERVPQTTDVENLRFSVPLPLLKRFVADGLKELLPDLPQVPTNMIPARWTARLDVSNDEAAKVQLELALTVLSASPSFPAKVRLFSTAATYENLRLDDKLTLPLQEQGWHVLRFSEAGEYRVTAELVIRPSRSGDERSIRLSKQPFVISTVALAGDSALELWAPGVPGRVRGGQGVLAVGPRGEFEVRWGPARAPVARRGTPSVTPSIAWTVGERLLSANARLAVRIVGGGAEQFELALPGAADNIEVRGPDVRDFRATGSHVIVFFKRRVSGGTLVNLSFAAPRPAGEVVTLPEISVPGGRVVEGGWLLVSNDAGGELLENRVSGLTPAAQFEAPGEVVGLAAVTPAYVYRRTSRSSSAAFDLVLTLPFPLVDTIADKAEITVVVRPGGEEITKITYAMRNNRRQYMRMTLPPGARILSLKVEDEAVKPVIGRNRSADDANDVLIPLAKSIQTLESLLSFPIEIVYCRQGRALDGYRERELDLPELHGVPTAQVKVTLLLPERAEFRDFRGALSRIDAFADGVGPSMAIGYAHAKLIEATADEDKEADKKDAGKKPPTKKKGKRFNINALNPFSKNSWSSESIEIVPDDVILPPDLAALDKIGGQESGQPGTPDITAPVIVDAPGMIHFNWGDNGKPISGDAFGKTLDAAVADPAGADKTLTWEYKDPDGNTVVNGAAPGAQSRNGAFSTFDAAPPGAKLHLGELNRDLARNYYNEGYKAYRDNRLEEARELLSNTLKMSPKSQEAQDAQQLLGNIDASMSQSRGGEQASREERAKVAALQKQAGRYNVKYEARQHELIAEGLKQLEHGNEEVSAGLLREAENLRGQLTQRGASAVEQEARQKQYQTQLEDVEKKLGDNKKLLQELAGLQERAQRIVQEENGEALAKEERPTSRLWGLSDGPEEVIRVGTRIPEPLKPVTGPAAVKPVTAPEKPKEKPPAGEPAPPPKSLGINWEFQRKQPPNKAEVFARALEKAAADEKQDLGEVQDLAFGNAQVGGNFGGGAAGGGTLRTDPAGTLDARSPVGHGDGYITKFDNQVRSAPSQQQGQQGLSLDDRNRRLEQQVRTLKKAIDTSEKAPRITVQSSDGTHQTEKDILIVAGDSVTRDRRAPALGEFTVDAVGNDGRAKMIANELDIISLGPKHKPPVHVGNEIPYLTESFYDFGPGGRRGADALERHARSSEENARDDKRQREIQRRVAQVRGQTETLLSDFVSQNSDEYLPAQPQGGTQTVAAADDLRQEKDLEQLERMVTGYYNAYSNESGVVRKELDELKGRLAVGKDRLAKAREKRKEAQVVTFDVSDITRGQSQAEQISLQNFLNDNYAIVSFGPDGIPVGGRPGVGSNESGLAWGQGAAQFAGDTLNVSNEGSNAIIFNEALEQFRFNSGQVVSFAGANVDNPTMSKQSDLGGLLANKTDSGLQYGVLDEAQYRTLLELGRKMDGWRSEPEGVERQGQREVIVGTPNTVVGQDFRLNRADFNANGIMVGGTEVMVPLDRYLAVNNGRVITVIKAGQVRDWRDRAEATVELVTEVDSEIELPLAGRPYYFEKTLLPEGESADLTLTYDWHENGDGFGRSLVKLLVWWAK